jgi:hypothetical protein
VGRITAILFPPIFFVFALAERKNEEQKVKYLAAAGSTSI